MATGLAFSWLNLLLGLAVRDPESAGLAGLFPIIILFFASSTLVPVATGGLRALCLGGPTTRLALEATAWLIGLLAVTVPAAVASYRHATST